MTVIDDINLPFGQIRIREKGSAGGHNGLKDIQLQLGNDAYARLRIGVGAVPQDSTLVEHVLGEFTKDEQVHIEIKLQHPFTVCHAMTPRP
jgi:PTH1 family peptidyl-tRNA hydrolase